MDKIGVLGKKDNKTIGTHIVYAPAPGKGARARLFYHGVSKTGSKLTVRVSNLNVFATGVLQNNDHHYSSELIAHNGHNNAPDGSAPDKTVEPYGGDYLLGALDSIEYMIDGADFDSMLFQVVGVEVDV